MYVSEEFELFVEKDALLEKHHHKDTEEGLNKLDDKGLDDSSIDTDERNIPTGKFPEEEKNHNINMKSEEEREFDDQFDLAKDFDRFQESI